MRLSPHSLVPALATLVALGTLPATADAQYYGYGLVSGPSGQQLVRFNTATPGSTTVLGATGATLTGIDFRPATGELWGFDGGNLYRVNVSTGAATFAFATTAASGNAAFDFNPVPDRLRVVSPDGTNLRINPNNGVAIVDGAYTYGAGDVSAGATPSFTAFAYTNSDRDPATGTTAYAVDANLGTLVRLPAPNGGDVVTVGSLGLGMMAGVLGFDIITVGTTNVAFLTTSGMGTPASRLYRVDLGTGATTFVGDVGTSASIEGLALQTVPEPGTWALLATGLAGVAFAARRRRTS